MTANKKTTENVHDFNDHQSLRNRTTISCPLEIVFCCPFAISLYSSWSVTYSTSHEAFLNIYRLLQSTCLLWCIITVKETTFVISEINGGSGLVGTRVHTELKLLTLAQERKPLHHCVECIRGHKLLRALYVHEAVYAVGRVKTLSRADNPEKYSIVRIERNYRRKKCKQM